MGMEKLRGPGQSGSPTASGREQLFQADRQVAHAHARGMEDGVGHRGVASDIAKLVEALDAERVHPVVRLGHEDRLDILNVGVNGDQVVGQIRVDISCGSLVDSVASRRAALKPR